VSESQGLLHVQVRRLVPSDADAYQALRLQALRDSPNAFSSSYEEECNTPIEVIEGFLAPESGRNVFGAFIETQLVGMIGVGRESQRKTNHKAFIRSMYVAPSARGKGVAKRLLGEALAFAASMGGVRQVTLSVTAGNPAAIALYESMGFRSFGVEPGAFLIDGVLHDDIHMVRPIVD
jgi:ribosomal protein S18 acetylase RimI-like enzyme